MLVTWVSTLICSKLSIVGEHSFHLKLETRVWTCQMFTLHWNHCLQLICSFHWRSSPVSLQSDGGAQPGAQAVWGGLWDALSGLPRFDPVVLFRWFEDEESGLTSKSLCGNLGLPNSKDLL
jgi:hypothetical protein